MPPHFNCMSHTKYTRQIPSTPRGQWTIPHRLSALFSRSIFSP